MIKLNYAKLHKNLLRVHSLVPTLLTRRYAFPPLFVQIEVTHRCNMMCSMCFLNKNTGAKEELSLSEIKDIVDQTPLWSILTLTGGEPFLRKDFLDILDYVLKKRRCNIVTNGSLITDEFIDLFVSRKLLLIGVSLDGIGETHDGIRRKGGSFNEAVEVIKKIQRAKENKGREFPLIDIKTIIIRQNLSQLFQILELSHWLKVDFLSYSLPKLSEIQFNEPYRDDLNREIFSSSPNPPEAFSSSELETLEEQISLIKKYQGEVVARFYPYNMLSIEAIRKYYDNRLKRDDFRPCYLPWSIVCISPYGDVYPCLSYRIGNIREFELRKLWNNERFYNFRSKLDKRNLSSSCLGCCYSVYRRK